MADIALKTLTDSVVLQFPKEVADVQRVTQAQSTVIAEGYRAVKESNSLFAAFAKDIETANAPHFAALTEATAMRTENAKTNELIRGITTLFDPTTGTDYWDKIIRNESNALDVNSLKLRTRAQAAEATQKGALTDISIANSKIAQEQADVNLFKDQMNVANAALTMQHNAAINPLLLEAAKLGVDTQKVQFDVLQQTVSDEKNKRTIDAALYAGTGDSLLAQIKAGTVPTGLSEAAFQDGVKRKVSNEAALAALRSGIYDTSVAHRNSVEADYLNTTSWVNLSAIAQQFVTNPKQDAIVAGTGDQAVSLHRANVIKAYKAAFSDTVASATNLVGVKQRAIINTATVNAAISQADTNALVTRGSAKRIVYDGDGIPHEVANYSPKEEVAIAVAKQGHIAVQSSGVSADVMTALDAQINSDLSKTMQAITDDNIKRLSKDNSPEAQAQVALLQNARPTSDNLIDININNLINPNSGEINNPIWGGVNNIMRDSFMPFFKEAQDKKAPAPGASMFSVDAEGNQILNLQYATVKDMRISFNNWLQAKPDGDTQFSTNRERVKNLYANQRAPQAFADITIAKIDALLKSKEPGQAEIGSELLASLFVDQGRGVLAFTAKVRTGNSFDPGKFIAEYEKLAPSAELLTAFPSAMQAIAAQDQQGLNVNEMGVAFGAIGAPGNMSSIYTGMQTQYHTMVPKRLAELAAEKERLVADEKTLKQLELGYPLTLAALFAGVYANLAFGDEKAAAAIKNRVVK